MQPEVIQLRFDIIHEEGRVEAADRPVNFHLSEIERQQAAPLLPGGAEIRKRFPVQQKNHVVPMRTDGGESPALVRLPRLSNSLPELFLHLDCIQVLCAGVGFVLDLEIFPLAERVGEFATDILHMQDPVPEDAASFLHQFFFPTFQKGGVHLLLSSRRGCEEPVSLLQRTPVSGKALHMSGADGEHRAIQESAPFPRPPSHNLQMFLGKCQDVETSNEFSQNSRFPVHEKLLVLLTGQGDAEFSGQSPVCDNAIHEAFLLPVPDAVSRYGGPEAPSVAEEVHSFEEIGFSLSVLPEEEIRARAEFDLLQIEIPVLI